MVLPKGRQGHSMATAIYTYRGTREKKYAGLRHGMVRTREME